MSAPSTWIQRSARAVAAVAIVIVVSFLFVHIVPGDPARAILGPQASPAAVQELHHALGLDSPLGDQFVRYVGGVLRGDLGTSVANHLPVAGLIADRLAPTVLLIVYASVLAIVFTVPAATLAAMRRGAVIDHAVRLLPLVALGLPAFWLALMLIQLLAVRIPIFPAGGYGETAVEHFQALTLPAFVTAVAILPFTIQSLRVSMVEVFSADYVAAARARGVPGRDVLLHHVLRNAGIPTVVVLGLNIGWLIGSTVIVEKIFAIPGIGALLIDATLSRDFPVVQGIALVIAVLVIGINLLTDVVRMSVDPRLRTGTLR
ncbi:hypothetical protein B1R94_14395 [Mycolicibacterium litorale]|nr:hypothetical protein B1R94_14395 [Mycolicibacterium litorale]